MVAAFVWIANTLKIKKDEKDAQHALQAAFVAMGFNVYFVVVKHTVDFQTQPPPVG